MGLSQEAELKLQRMRESYKQSLADKKQDIERDWSQCLLSDWRRDEVHNLAARLHKLAGSAGLYGFTALGDAARELEKHLATLPQCAGSVDTQLLGLMAELQSCFKEAE